ncbi:MAG: septation protein SpoVG family protein [candidate division KSB1 bacterium]|nr:septation protein SpoVG family protein [candidate division KSB1 bacterium]
MKITEICVKLRDEHKLKAFVNVTFEDAFSVKGMKIIKSKRGLLL